MEFGKKNVTSVLTGERTMFVKCVVQQRGKEEGDIHTGRWWDIE